MSYGKLVSVREVKNHRETESAWSGMDGYEVVMENDTVLMLITNEQSCCENWGYFTTEYEGLEFIGTEVYDVKIVDTGLNVERLKQLGLHKPDDYYEGDAMFVNFETSKGVLQFTVYNSHNGYYGHRAIVRSKNLNFDTTL